MFIDKERVILDRLTIEQEAKWLSEIEEYNRMINEKNELYFLNPLSQLEIENVAGYLLEQARFHEKEITNDLYDFVDDTTSFAELDNRFKGKNRLKEKIYHKSLNEQLSILEVSSQINDTLRYTFIIDDDEYIKKIEECLSDLESRGYEVFRFQNDWCGLLYKGINVKLKNGQGFKFEIQFHTKKSFEVKEGKTRELYNLLRNKNAPINLRLKAELLRRFYQQSVKMPYNSLDYQYESQNKRATY